jgi:hypothetical protein
MVFFGTTATRLLTIIYLTNLQLKPATKVILYAILLILYYFFLRIFILKCRSMHLPISRLRAEPPWAYDSYTTLCLRYADARRHDAARKVETASEEDTSEAKEYLRVLNRLI